jgi:hypothetical protein
MSREKLAAIYLDFVNNYLTIYWCVHAYEKFAEHNGLWTDEAVRLIALAKDFHETQPPEA